MAWEGWFLWEGKGPMKPTSVHPVAELFPMLDKHDLQALAADIKANGLQQPLVVTKDGMLVDGRNRLAACEIAGVEPTTTTLNGVDPVLYIISSNAMRRHMTKGQIAIVAARAEAGNQDHDSRGDNDHDNRGLGWKVNAHKRVATLVSETMVNEAGLIVEHAPDLADGVLAGTSTWRDAISTARKRRQEVVSDESRIAILKEDSPDLAAAVEEETLSVTEAWATRSRRQDEEREARRRTTNYLDDHIGWLIGMQQAADEQITETASRYDPSLSTHQLTKADLDLAIKVIQRLKRGWH